MLIYIGFYILYTCQVMVKKKLFLRLKVITILYNAMLLFVCNYS